MASRPAPDRLQPFRRISVFLRRRGLRPAAELLALAVLGATLFASYLVLVRGQPGEPLLAPPLTALLLVANLIPALFLQVLIGRRLARRRAHQSVVGGHGRLHARLVSLFSVIAAIPVLLLVIFASLLFQYGFDFWYSQKARGIFENANSLAQTYYKEKQQTIINETEVMAGDIGYNLGLAPLESEAFASSFGFQVFQRNLSEGAILRITSQNGVQSLAIVNPYNRPAQNWVPPEVVQSLLGKGQTVFRDSGNRMEAVTPIPDRKDLFLYASRVDNSAALAQTKRFSLVLKDYNGLLDRFRTLQLQFHATLFFLTLLIVGVAVWVALTVADRLVAPIGELVGAARKVSAGDLSTRVANSSGRDEVGVLGNAFNVMTSRLEEQRRELVDANALLERRRGLIEAVLSGVTAGVIAVDENRNIRMINDFAASHLGLDVAASAGRPLGELSAELNGALQAGLSERVIELERGGDKRTLAVKSVADAYGHVITFDDITQQLTDQRAAAWADVARRVAHEIKNPLTPIQLAAERLRRRFGQGEGEDPATVTRLTDTIIRQVGDLRRMVDEFSSFARMPKPVFSPESLTDICRQAIFLHEVAHPAIKFSYAAPEGLPMVTCDRRQLGQAMTNIIKNGVEAIGQKTQLSTSEAIAVQVQQPSPDQVRIIVSDTGIGLPVERERIVEPYMTTRQSGTGLGLAIVKKIVEEHGGSIGFDDRKGGGAVVWIDLPLVAGQPVSTDTTDPVEPHHPRNLTRAEHS
jgi:two-component system, NtrC family, nitrogen regulation sensor histidine kinase NtrY